MDPSWAALNADSPRAAQVIRHPSATFVDLLNGTASDGIDLSQYVSACKHTTKDADVTFAYHTALNGAAQPQPGELLELRMNGQFLWVGVIDSVSAYRFKSGEHTLAVKAYSRDNMPAWKDVQLVTNIYPSGTPTGVIASDIAESIGLTAEEISLPPFGTYTVHSNTQLANLSAQAMLDTLLLPSGYSTYVDARGVLRAIQRDLGRPSDLVLTEDRLVSIDASKSRSPVTSVRIRWLDPNLSLSVRQDQSLAQSSITAGFFQLSQKQDIYFSQDRTQRAQNTYLVVKQSANSGLLPVCSESYSQLTPTQGRIELDTSFWAPALATAGLAGLLSASYIPDDVAAFGGGVTIPVGRVVEATSEIALLLVMMSIGTGMYEVWGQPFDYVHARNCTEANAAGVAAWLLKVQEIQNDFVMNEAQAQAFAARELIYQARSAEVYKATIVDDPRIERGDIVELYDGSRLYVTDFTRQLNPGAAPELQLQGFRA